MCDVDVLLIDHHAVQLDDRHLGRDRIEPIMHQRVLEKLDQQRLVLRSELADRRVIRDTGFLRLQPADDLSGGLPGVGQGCLPWGIDAVIFHEPQEVLERRPADQIQALIRILIPLIRCLHVYRRTRIRAA